MQAPFPPRPRVPIVIDNRVRIRRADLPDAVAEELQAEFRHENPDYIRKLRMGVLGPGEPAYYRTWREEDDWLTFPRGGYPRIRAILETSGLRRVVADHRTEGEMFGRAAIPDHKLPLYDYQQTALDAALLRENCILRAPTGSGKTTVAFALAAKLKLPTLVVVWTGGLFRQWQERAESELGLAPKDVGVLRGKERRLRPLTIAMQQTLSAQGVDEELRATFGMVICDELQRFAAPTLFEAIDPFPARYRIGISADECVVRGTLVTMGDGSSKPIEEVRAGDSVLTPLGPRRVVAAMFKGIRETVDVRVGHRVVRCTSNTWFGSQAGWHGPGSVCEAYVCEEGPTPGGSGVGGDSVPGDVRALEAAGESLASVRATVGTTWLMAPTFDLEVEDANCFFANGVLVHNSRKDQKEFLIYDLFGAVAADIPRKQVIRSGRVLEVEIRVVPTQFASTLSGDFDGLLAQMAADPRREGLIDQIVHAEAGEGEQLMVLSHRRDHCVAMDQRIAAMGIRTGLLLGGREYESVFAETIDALKAGRLQACVGTVQAIGQGLDLPALSVGVVTTPVAGNRQLFGQVRGRVCRVAEGKAGARLYYLWDRRYYGLRHLENLVRWNQRVLVLEGGEWLEARQYLATLRERAYITA